MLVMLMPGLACGPFMAGIGKAHAAMVREETVRADIMPDCHGMAAAEKDANGKTPEKGGGTRLFKDCAGIDLCDTDHIVLKKPDMSGKLFPATWTDRTFHPAFTLSMDTGIRGPPREWPGLLSKTQPSVLSTTQRFRE